MSRTRLIIASFVFIVCLVAHRVQSQDSRLATEISNAAIALDSSAMSRHAPFDLQNKINLNFKVLGIGEQSHGTSEFFKARISLIKSLAKTGKITKIGLEAPFAEVENLNVYVKQHKGDLRQILKSFRLFNYECEEFVDLVENVKALNESSKSQLTFFGIDMQSPFQALHNLSEFCGTSSKAAADSIKKLTEYYRLLDNEMYNHLFSKEDFAELSDISDQIFIDLSKAGAACLEKGLVKRSIKNYKQFLMLNDPEHSFQVQATVRDSLMAANVMEELRPGDQIVVLAHNGHLQRTPNTYSKSMGFFLAQKLGAEYQCIALTTSAGFYTAFTPEAGKITDKNVIPAAKAGTFEFEFSKMKKPLIFFKTSTVKQKNGTNALPERYKLLPFGLTDKPFIEGNLFDDFDYVLHIEKTVGNKSFYLK